MRWSGGKKSVSKFLSKISASALVISALWCLLSITPANAQFVTSPSAGCNEANAGTYDFTVPINTPLTSSPFTAQFAVGEMLTITLDAFGGVVLTGIARDTTAGATLIDSPGSTSVIYSIPSSGIRSFELVLETSDFTGEFTVRCTPNPVAPVQQAASNSVRNYIYRRTNALLEKEPDRPRLARKDVGSLWPNGIQKMHFEGDQDRGSLEFGTSHSNPWADEMDVWVEGHYTWYDYDNDIDVEGEQAVLYFGVDYTITSDVLIGVLGQTDWTNESADAIGEDLEGSGWMVGPYFSAQLTQNLFFDARAAWGRSENTLTLGTLITNEEFDTERWLVRANLTGNEQFGAEGRWRLTPSAAIVYFEEEQEEYSTNTNVTILAQTVGLGRATFEPEFAYHWITSKNTLIEPQLTLTGIWDFDPASGLAIPGFTYETDQWRASIEASIQVAWTSGVTLRASGFYDGIGARGFEARGARIWLDLPLDGLID